MSNNKIMTVKEWMKAKYPHPHGGFVIPQPEMVQEYAEYYHAEKVKQVGNDAEQEALKQYPVDIDSPNELVKPFDINEDECSQIKWWHTYEI
jgi:hypothetical protein